MGPVDAAITVRDLTPSDREGVVMLLTEVFDEGDADRARLTWDRRFDLWVSQRPTAGANVAAGWVAVGPSEGIVGCMFNIAVPYAAGRQEWTGCIASSLAVRESHRGKGIAAAIGRRFLDQPEAGLLVGTGSSNAALSLWHRLGMKSLNCSWTKVRLLIPIHRDRFVAHFGSRLCRGRWLATAAHAATRPGVRALSHLDRDSEFECRAYETAASLPDDGLERLFTENEVHRRFRREDLHWYYFAPVRQGVRVWLLCAYIAGSIVGMMVLRITESPTMRYDVMEFKCHRSYPGAARAMLSTMASVAAEEGAGYVSVRPFSRGIVGALPIGSFIPTYSNFAYVWSVRNSAIAARRDGLYTSPGDGDCCFL